MNYILSSVCTKGASKKASWRSNLTTTAENKIGNQWIRFTVIRLESCTGNPNYHCIYYPKQVKQTFEGFVGGSCKNANIFLIFVMFKCYFGNQGVIILCTAKVKNNKNSIPQSIGQTHITTAFSNMVQFPSRTRVRQTCSICS